MFSSEEIHKIARKALAIKKTKGILPTMVMFNKEPVILKGIFQNKVIETLEFLQ